MANQQTLAFTQYPTAVTYTFTVVGPKKPHGAVSDGYAVLQQLLDAPGGNVVESRQQLFWYPSGKDHDNGDTTFGVAPGSSYQAFIFENYALPDGTEAPPVASSNIVTFTA